jgi:hypothetical protein
MLRSMKNKILPLTACILFLTVNTAFFWEGKLGPFAIILSLILVIVYGVLIISLLYQIYLEIREKFKNRQRLISITIVAVVLGLIYFRPDGIINFEKFQGNDLVIAEREGAANCYTTLKLKDNNRFVEKNICFGISEVTGKYSIKGDSIFFSDVQLGRDKSEYYQFAVIKQSAFENKKIIGELKRFMNYSDTLPHELWITKNELKN